jgi:hypothetical protein
MDLIPNSNSRIEGIGIPLNKISVGTAIYNSPLLEGIPLVEFRM